MLSPPALTAAIAGVHHLAVPFSELTFRATHLRHFHNVAVAPQPLFCAAAGPAGSRFVAPSGPAALYVALDADTAYQEFNQDFFRVARTPPGRRLVRAGRLRPDPCVMLGVHFRVSRLLNLASPIRRWHATRTALGINTSSDAEITRPWAGLANPSTQVLGTEVFGGNFFEGIIYPSARSPGHNCIVVFRDRLLPTSRIHFSDAATAIAGQLP
jgi:RES domain-containing protein